MTIPSRHPLRLWRLAEGVNQAEAAARVGITQGMWSRLERGGYARPSVAKRLSDLTGVALERLLNLGDNPAGVVHPPLPAETPEIPKDMP